MFAGFSSEALASRIVDGNKRSPSVFTLKVVAVNFFKSLSVLIFDLTLIHSLAVGTVISVLFRYSER